MMNAQKLRLHLRFIGSRAVALLGVGAATGIVLGLVEVGFAYSLQAFLASLGMLDARAAALPKWLPHGRISVVLALVAGFGMLRGLLQAFYHFTQNITLEEVLFTQRTRILHAALQGDSASSTHVTTLFNARALSTASAVYSAQGIVVQVCMAAFLGATLLAMAPLVTLAAAAALLLLAPPMLWWDRKIKNLSSTSIAHWDKTNSRLLMSIRNLLLLQICGMQDREEALAQDSLRSYLREMKRVFLLSSLKLGLAQIGGPVIVCLIAIGVQRQGLMAPIALLGYFYLFLRLIQAFTAANQALASFVFGLPHYQALFQWWTTAPKAPVQHPAAVFVPAAAAAKVGWKLSGVSFAYPGGPAPVILRLDLIIEPGSTVVVTGPSGAGKSTLLGLLLGTFTPQHGAVEVLCDGRCEPLKLCRARLLAGVGYVGPESFLLEGTIAQNITYGLTASIAREDIERALRLAECHFVFSLPAGLEHALTEQGQGLSAGQKQRLSLARALLRRPTVLILDEATSNLDMETEARLVDTLSRLKGTMTIVAVTHRRELLRIADQHVSLDSEEAPSEGASAR